MIPGDGSTKKEIGLGVSSLIDVGESYDIEAQDVDNVIGLGATENYSMISGNSDSVGANGLPIIQNLQLPDAGANPYKLVISGGYETDADKPSGKLLNKIPYVIVPYLGAIDTFLLFAQRGEKCLSDAATAIVGATAAANKLYICTKTAGRTIDNNGADLATATITGSADNAGDIQFTCSGATALNTYVSAGDIIHVSGANGDASELGQHYVKAVTATTITVETNWHAGSASTAGTIRLSALVEQVNSTAI